jgi:hypothetical protein
MARNSDIRTLLAEFYRRPDRRFRVDSSDPDATTMRGLLSGYVDEFKRTPCERYIPVVRRALGIQAR